MDRSLGKLLNAGFRPCTTGSFGFGQRTQNHFRPYATPMGSLRLRPEYDGEGTRCAQTAFAGKSIRDRGSAAPNAGEEVRKTYFGNDQGRWLGAVGQNRKAGAPLLRSFILWASPPSDAAEPEPRIDLLARAV